MTHYVIHTDGGCEGNPGPGGWAAIVRHGDEVREISGGEPATTNNRMELQAAIEALRLLDEPATVDFYTDSTYLRNGISEWLPAWKARGWRTAGKKPVKNADLWRELDARATRHRITWRWVRGHSGNPDNERADRLVGMEITNLLQRYSRQELRRLLDEFLASTEQATQGRMAWT